MNQLPQGASPVLPTAATFLDKTGSVSMAEHMKYTFLSKEDRILENKSRIVEMWKVFRTGEARRISDTVLEEASLTLEVDGEKEVSVILTPGDKTDWALGNLRCRRRILALEDVREIVQSPGRIAVSRAVPREGIPPARRLIHTAATGLVEKERIHNPGLTPLPAEWTTGFDALIGAVEELARAPLFRKTGSVHVAVLAEPDGEILHRVEDVGRHNAVDKAIGWALRHGTDLGKTFMAVSGRLPADMVHKAIGAGIPLLASVSAVTAGGIEAARAGGITLIGFAREGRMNVYTCPERIREIS